jgi:ribulose-phosphate 3-epimerase
MAPGVTLNPGTPVGLLEVAARSADNLLCMSVNPGWGGQTFIPASIERIAVLREMARPGAGVEVDGGVGPDTIEACARAGANRFTAGSAIFGSADPAAAYHDLVERVRAATARVAT